MSKWIERQQRDPFVKSRNREKKVSRAYYKIQAINEKFNMIRKNSTVLDLGGSPGGWSQYFSEITDNVVAIDILDRFQVPNVNFICGDIFDESVYGPLGKFSIIASDISPNLSGNKILDNCNSFNLWEQVFHVAKEKLKPGGHIIIKTFESDELTQFIFMIKKFFKLIKRYKPESSRQESREIFIVAFYFKNIKL